MSGQAKPTRCSPRGHQDRRAGSACASRPDKYAPDAHPGDIPSAGTASTHAFGHVDPKPTPANAVAHASKHGWHQPRQAPDALPRDISPDPSDSSLLCQPWPRPRRARCSGRQCRAFCNVVRASASRSSLAAFTTGISPAPPEPSLPLPTLAQPAQSKMQWSAMPSVLHVVRASAYRSSLAAFAN